MSALPQPWRTLSGEIKKLQEQVRRLSNASAFTGSGLSVIDTGQIVQDGAVTIPNNGLLLVDGGDVIMLNDAMVEVFRIGIMPAGDTGLQIKRGDGSVALEMFDVFGGGIQSLVIRDRAGRQIAGDPILSNTGFDAPHIPVTFIPVDPTTAGIAVTTSATTFTATHEHRGFRQNPALRPQFKVRCSDGSTAAEIQVWDALAGVYLGGFFGTPAVQTITVPVGTTAFTVFGLASGSLALPGLMSDPTQLEVHVRVTAGTGSVTVAPVRTIGTGF